MSKYAISHEEEGTYHRREVDCRPRSPVTTTTITSYVDRKPLTRQSDDEDECSEWTTSRRKVNHKTRQVETRVSRQLLVRGGEVIADTGPQITTRIKEDNKQEDFEKEKRPKNQSGFEELANAPEVAEASGRVLGEKKQVQRVTREVRQEDIQYHDESFKELTGKDVHRRAINAPEKLIAINSKADAPFSKPPGKVLHYSNRGKKFEDVDEILEVAKLASDGSVTKEVKRTKHHEEFSEDELPDEKGEAEQLKRKPVVERSSRRHADYVNDFDAADDEPAFSRYDMDPLLNSLRDEDFRPRRTEGSVASSHDRRVPVVIGERSGSRRSHLAATSSSDEEEAPRRSTVQRPRSPPTRVEVPEMYRVKKTSSKIGQSGRRREEAGTQARLTDEEVERHSLRSPSVHSHEKATRHLQRQSTPNSSRRYYYGDSQRMKQQPSNKKRPTSLSSSSSNLSLSSDNQERSRRKDGAQSRDSGFKSPQSNRSSERPGAISPTSQRSVKTTTRTLSAGLADRQEVRSKNRASDKPAAISVPSPNVTRIKVPYQRVITIEREPNHNKYRENPAHSLDDEDQMSQSSTSSLQSARTYNIRKLHSSTIELKDNSSPQLTRKATAWIFDPRDNSTKAIVVPPKPTRPEAPKVDTKTEDLDERRGGRSYYLELVEPRLRPKPKVTKPSKYSIYGGFRKPGEGNKPVPRLSYSRAIGPRSTRKDATPTAPSRYLKVR